MGRRKKSGCTSLVRARRPAPPHRLVSLSHERLQSALFRLAWTHPKAVGPRRLLASLACYAMSRTVVAPSGIETEAKRHSRCRKLRVPRPTPIRLTGPSFTIQLSFEGARALRPRPLLGASSLRRVGL